MTAPSWFYDVQPHAYTDTYTDVVAKPLNLAAVYRAILRRRNTR